MEQWEDILLSLNDLMTPYIFRIIMDPLVLPHFREVFYGTNVLSIP